MRIFIAVIVLIFNLQSWTKADDIRDFEIEGISIGDSLLDHITEKDLKKEINLRTDKGCTYKSKDYCAITLGKSNLDLKNYYQIQFHYKNNDKKYIIKSISGINKMNFEKCNTQIHIIEEVLDDIFKNSTKKNKPKDKHSYDKTGNSFHAGIYYFLDDDSVAVLACTDWSDAIVKEKNAFYDHLRVTLNSSKFSYWLNYVAYE